MPQSLSSILIHLIFSTKNREPFITQAIEPELYKYLGGILRNQKCPSIVIGGDKDHIHNLAFEHEFREICQKYDVEIDERYVWD